MPNIKHYVIHCDAHTERIPNIQRMHFFLQGNIEVVPGIYTPNVSMAREDQLAVLRHHDPNLGFEQPDYQFTMCGQLGCYLSHHLLIKRIVESGLTDGYTVIFEDDAIFQPTIVADIEHVVATMEQVRPDFDLVFLGNLKQDCHGNRVANNVYELDGKKELWGTHALLINNKKARKIYDLNCSIYWPMDGQYKRRMMTGQLSGYIVHPILAFQDLELKSRIWNR
jgi:GR25 family glycosyltransferase involved in LPS biosynthesis